MNYYYIELDENGKIISYGESVGIDQALSKTTGKVLEITQAEYALVSACRGHLLTGIGVLQHVIQKINKQKEDEG